MSKKIVYIIILFLIIACLTAFGRIVDNDFINFDDDILITENINVQSGFNFQNIKWTFSTTHKSYWHPLTWLSITLDWNLFGANATGHHIVSLFLHIGAVIFLFLFLNKTTNKIWLSAFVAAFFALHPLKVESVAWASERKDVLSMFFGMASIYAYAFYIENNKFFKYLLCIILFALALMSKPMLVTLPFVLLLLDYWPLQRLQKASNEKSKVFNQIWKLVWEKIPFFILIVATCIITFWAQNKEGAVANNTIWPLARRASNAIVSYISYLGKTFWPFNMAIFYPYESYIPIWEILISSTILVVITLFVLYYIKKLPFLLVGWLWYLGTLIPVIGVVQVGEQAMADRYTYLPSIGIAIILAWGISSLIKSETTRKKLLFPAAIVFLAILMVLTWNQCGYWQNSIKLFKHTLQITKNNVLAHNNLGLALFAEKKIDEAIGHFNTAINTSPIYYPSYHNRGVIYHTLGMYKNAIIDYNKEIHLKPDYAEAYNNRGNAYQKLGQHQLAVNDFNEAIRLKPDHASIYYNRGTSYINLANYQQAIEDYNKAISLNSDYFEAYNNRAFIYLNLGQYQKALEDYNKAILIKPDYADAYNNRAFVYLTTGNLEYGCKDAKQACKLGTCLTLQLAVEKGLCH